MTSSHPVWKCPSDITADMLRDVLVYDPESGILTWKTRPKGHIRSAGTLASFNARMAGKPALRRVTKAGYFAGKIFNFSFLAHRVAWAIHYGQWPNGHIDHINGVPVDNRIANLRVVTQLENTRNARLSKRNKSGHVGVVKRRKKWAAFIGCDGGKQRYLGQFSEKCQAIAARKQADREIGFHPNHGRK